MVRPLVLAPLAALALSACVVAPVDSGYGMVGAPALPSIVEIGASPRQGQAHGLISPAVTTPERSGTTNVVTNGWASAAVVVGAGLVVVLVAWIVQVRRRNRQRTRMLEMRGSALW